MLPIINDDLLVKHLAGETNETENAGIQAWIDKSPANQRYYEHFKLIWEESEQLAANTTVDEQAAWNRFVAGVNNGQWVARTPPAIIKYNYWLRIAAAVIVTGSLAALSIVLLNRSKNVQAITVQAINDTRKDTLPDGSVVMLNKHSQISYPQKFNGQQRAVQLKGEAFFNVQPNASQPFIIQAGDVRVRVVGTSFNVRDRDSSTEVIVETGLVEVSYGQQKILLKPGEKILLHPGQSTLQKENNTDRLYSYYRSRQFICENTPLWRLVEILNEAYDVHIHIENEGIRNLPLTTTFNNEPLEKILIVIRDTFGVTVAEKNGQIVLQ